MKQCPSVLDAHDINFLLSTPQIHRSKNKWKFHLKDGIMNLNGRDYVFSKAIGDAEWWSRKKKKQTKRQEQELCNSFYPVNRHFNILPYPVTGFISGNFYRVFENSDKPKGLWGTVKTWVSSKKNTRLALRDEKPTAEGKACEKSDLYLLFFCLFCFIRASLPFFFPERIHTHWKVSISHRTGVVDQGDPTWRSEVIHYNPVDEKHLHWWTVVGWLDWLVSTFKSKLSATSQDCCL